MCKFIKKFSSFRIYKTIFEPLHLFLIGLLLIIGILLYQNNINVNIFLTSISASFVGAGSAFFLNTFYSRKKKRIENIASLEKTKYIIDVILKFNKQIKDHIDKCKSIPIEDFFEWEKITEYNDLFLSPNVDVQNLLFLLEDEKNGKETLDSILLVDAEKQTVINVLEKRNNMYSSYLDKTEERNYISKNELEKILGIKLMKYLEQWTDHLIEFNQNLLEDGSNALNKIDKFLEQY